MPLQSIDAECQSGKSKTDGLDSSVYDAEFAALLRRVTVQPMSREIGELLRMSNKRFYTIVMTGILTALVIAAALIGISLATAQEPNDFDCIATPEYISCTSNYTLNGGYKYNHSAITYHCSAPQIGAALAEMAKHAGIGPGDCQPDSATVDIAFLVYSPSDWPFGAGVAGAAAWYGNNGTVRGCTVHVPQQYEQHMGVITHEVMHCAGLGHTTVPGQMMNAYCCSPMGFDDIAGLRALYGPTALPTATPSPTPPATPTAVPGGCASSIWLDPDGTVHGPFVSCSPYRLVMPGLARE